MLKRLVIMLLIVGLVLGGVFGFVSFKGSMMKKYMSAMASSPQTVSTTQAQMLDWKTTVFAVGTLRAVRGVDISNELAGVVENIFFESGDEVAANTLLVQLRADDDIAALEALRADAQLAEITYKRDYRQLQEKAVPQSTADSSLAALQKARSLVAQQEALIAKKYVRAPFAGRLGLRSVDIGQYLAPGTTIVTLQELDPIYFDFYLPQQDLVKIKVEQSITLKSETQPDQVYTGKIWAINSKVDPTTRNVQIRAVLDNKNGSLLPGMFAQVEIDLGVTKQYITVPQTAITYNAYGNTVFIVQQQSKDDKGDPKYVAEQRFVTLGPTRGDQVAVIDGLKAGEEIVTTGQVKLQNGTVLKINNSVTPSNDIDPQPYDD